jgi:putative ABC transport system permease protein
MLGDLRLALRVLAKSPALTVAALLTIALGVGATTSVFSLINAVLLRSLPYANADRLVYMWTPNPRLEGVPREMSPPYADVFVWQEQSRSFTSITALNEAVLSVDDGGEPARISCARVLPNFLDTMGAQPARGRGFDGDSTVLISDALWHSRYGSRADTIGRSIKIGSRSYRIAGIMPPEFAFPHNNDYPYASAAIKRTEIWIPLTLTPEQRTSRMDYDTDLVIGRLKDGVSLAQAQTETSAIEKTLDPLYPPEFRGWESMLVPLPQSILGPVRPLLRILMGAVFLVLLIACSNVANLLMARAAGRVHEMGVRAALGAARTRLIRQMLSESLVLSVVGGALGTLLTFTALRTVAKLNPGDIPRFDEATVDSRVLLFTLGISIASGLLFGILPALSASGVNIANLLRAAGGRGIASGSSRARSAVIVLEIALAVVLLAGAGLLVRSYLTVLGEDKGFAPSTLTMKIALPARAGRDQQQIADANARLVAAARAIPGVESASGIDALPLTHRETVSFLEVEGQPPRSGQTAHSRTITGDYLTAMQIRLLAGRALTDADIPPRSNEPPRVVLVSETFARIYFPRGAAVGSRLRIGDRERPWATIVGVIADVRHTDLEAPTQPIVYQPSWIGGMLAVRTSLSGAAIAPSLRAALNAVENGVALWEIETMDQRIAEHIVHRRFQTVVLAVFAATAVVLALLGIYALLSYSVRQRTAEIGVRMALGASRTDVLAMVVKHGLVLTSIGLALGLAAASAAVRLISSLLFGVQPSDPLTFAAVPAIILFVAAGACIAPAWRASRVDPYVALRDQ